MRREHETARYLRTVRDVICHELYEDLGGKARDSADAVVRVLNRLIAEQENCDLDIGKRISEWRTLEGALKELADLPPATGPSVTFASRQHELESLIDQIQHKFVEQDLPRRMGSEAPWVKEATAALKSYTETIEARVAAPLRIERTLADASSPAEVSHSPDLLQTKFADYLRRRFPALPENPVESFRLLPGGNTKLTVIIELAPNDVLPTALVLKGDMGSGHTGTTVLTEFPALRATFDAGVPVPEPILAESDSTVLGGPFVVMTAIPGGSQMIRTTPEVNQWSSHSFVPIRPEFGEDVAVAMGRLHAIPPIEGIGEPQTAAQTHAVVEQYYERWRALDKLHNTLATDLCFAWLLTNPLPDDRPVCLVHGDLGGHNMLIRDGRLAAILDWELARNGDPAEDIGFAKMQLIERVTDWDRFCEHYLAAGGHPGALDPHALDYFTLWTNVRISVWCAMIGQDYLRGARNDINGAMNAWDTESRNQYNLSRALLAILERREGER